MQHRRLVTLRADLQGLPDAVPRDARVRERGRAAALLPGAEPRQAAPLPQRRDAAGAAAHRGSLAYRRLLRRHASQGERSAALLRSLICMLFPLLRLISVASCGGRRVDFNFPYGLAQCQRSAELS